MSVVNFADEMKQLIARWTSPASGKPSEDAGKSEGLLTNQQVLHVAHQILSTLLRVGPAAIDESMKTPANEILIITPHAPVVPKPNNQERVAPYRSLDTLDANLQSDNFLLPNPQSLTIKSWNDSQDLMEVSESDAVEMVSEEKKCVPELDIEKTWALLNTNVDKLFEVQGNLLTTSEINYPTEKMLNYSFLKKLEGLRKSAFDVLSKIDEMTKEMFPQKKKSIRRLSAIGCFPGTIRPPTVKKSNPSKMRRSITGIPGTPTSSRLNDTIAIDKKAAGKKSLSTIPMHVSSNMQRGMGNTRATSSLSLTKTSPNPGDRPAKNPKYAHVQSTIPKVFVAGKRKAQ